MRQKKAKMLRKSAYGDTKQLTSYEPQTRVNSKKEVVQTGAVVCTGLRRVYLNNKKNYIKGEN